MRLPSPLVREKQGQTVPDLLRGSHLRVKPFLVISLFGHDLLTIREPATHCLTQTSWGASAFPSLTTALICGYWLFSISQWKNTLRLKLRHTFALSLRRQRERSYTRTTHSKTKRVVVQFAFKLGYYSEELDYVEPKTASFRRFPKFWCEPNLLEW